MLFPGVDVLNRRGLRTHCQEQNVIDLRCFSIYTGHVDNRRDQLPQIPKTDAQITADRALIEAHGGPSELARKMGLDGPNSASRVAQWMRRGIPPAVKQAYPGLFMNAAVMSVRKRKVKS